MEKIDVSVGIAQMFTTGVLKTLVIIFSAGLLAFITFLYDV